MLAHRQTPARATESLDAYLRRLIRLCMLPLALALVVVTAGLVHVVHEQRIAKVQAAAQRFARQVDASLARRIHGLQALAVGAAARSKTIAEWHADARVYDAAFDAPVLLTDADRRILLASRRPLDAPLPPLPRPPGPSALDAALETGAPAVGNLVPGPIIDRLVIPVIVPANGLPGRMAWLASVPADHYRARIESEQLPAGWSLALLDATGQVIASNAADTTFVTRAPPGARQARWQTTRAPWTAVIDVDPSTFYRPHLQLGAALLVLLGTATAGARWWAGRSGRRLHAAITRLTDPRGHGAAPARDLPRIAEIDAVHEQLHRLQAAEREAEGRERQRVARELHDGLQQHLAAAQITAELLHASLRDRDAEAAELAARTSRITREGIRELRHVVNDLRPPAIERLGFQTALEQLIGMFRADTGLPIALEVPPGQRGLDSLPGTIADCLYRVTQECLNNVRKHAQASSARVLVDLSDPARLVLQVSDDGVGIAAGDEARPGSLGLAGIRQRVGALGGSLQVRNGGHGEAGRGTSIRLECPLGA